VLEKFVNTVRVGNVPLQNNSSSKSRKEEQTWNGRKIAIGVISTVIAIAAIAYLYKKSVVESSSKEIDSTQPEQPLDGNKILSLVSEQFDPTTEKILRNVIELGSPSVKGSNTAVISEIPEYVQKSNTRGDLQDLQKWPPAPVYDPEYRKQIIDFVSQLIISSRFSTAGMSLASALKMCQLATPISCQLIANLLAKTDSVFNFIGDYSNQYKSIEALFALELSLVIEQLKSLSITETLSLGSPSPESTLIQNESLKESSDSVEISFEAPEIDKSITREALEEFLGKLELLSLFLFIPSGGSMSVASGAQKIPDFIKKFLFLFDFTYDYGGNGESSSGDDIKIYKKQDGTVIIANAFDQSIFSVWNDLLGDKMRTRLKELETKTLDFYRSSNLAKHLPTNYRLSDIAVGASTHYLEGLKDFQNTMQIYIKQLQIENVYDKQQKYIASEKNSLIKGEISEEEYAKRVGGSIVSKSETKK
jgi:hypothetical protein